MGKKKDLIGELKAFKSELGSRIPVQKMLLFGSQANGKAGKDSDVDLIIVSRTFEGERFRFRPLGFRKYWASNLPVDFLCYTPKEFNRLKKQITLVREAVENGIEI
jgi:uncharacterized protein